MKKIFKITILLLSVSLFLTSCKEDDEGYKTFSRPVWQVSHSQYSVNMTAVVKLPNNLEQYAQADDVMAAFAGEVCRGIAENIDGLFYITIKGTPEDQEKIHFVYYNSRNQYMYETEGLFNFVPDAVYGTVNEPEVLAFSIIK